MSEDWDKFFLAANAEDADSLREMLADPEVRRQASRFAEPTPQLPPFPEEHKFD